MFHVLVTIETPLFWVGGDSQVRCFYQLQSRKKGFYFPGSRPWRKEPLTDVCQTFVISLKHFSRAQRSVSKSTDCHCVNQEGPESSPAHNHQLNVHGNVSWSGWGLSLRVQELCGQYKHGLKGWSSRDPTDFPQCLFIWIQPSKPNNTHTHPCNICKYNHYYRTLLFSEDSSFLLCFIVPE